MGPLMIPNSFLFSHKENQKSINNINTNINLNNTHNTNINNKNIKNIIITPI